MRPCRPDCLGVKAEGKTSSPKATMMLSKSLFKDKRSRRLRVYGELNRMYLTFLVNQKVDNVLCKNLQTNS